MYMSSVNIDVPHDLSEWEPHPSSWELQGYCALFLKRAYILGEVTLRTPSLIFFQRILLFLLCGPSVRIPELETWKGWKGLDGDSRACCFYGDD